MAVCLRSSSSCVCSGMGFSGCWARALGHCSAEARALRHSAAAQGLAHHRQAAGALGHDAAVSAHLRAGLLQRWQHRCRPVKAVLHVSLSTALLLFMWKWTQSSMCACADLTASQRRLWLEGIQLRPEMNNYIICIPIRLCFINIYPTPKPTPCRNIYIYICVCVCVCVCVCHVSSRVKLKSSSTVVLWGTTFRSTVCTPM